MGPIQHSTHATLRMPSRGVIHQELKHFDTEEAIQFQNLGGSPGYSTFISHTINPIVQGVASDQRIGNRVWTKGLELRGTVIINDHTTSSTFPNWDRVRLIVLINHQQNNVITIASDIMDTARTSQGTQVISTNSFYNPDGFDRFTILSDKTYPLVAATYDVTADQSMQVMTHINDSFNETVLLHFDADEPGDIDLIDNIVSNNIQLLLLSETSAARVNLNIRLYYTD